MRHDTVRLLWEAGREVVAVVAVVVLTFWEYGDWERTVCFVRLFLFSHE